MTRLLKFQLAIFIAFLPVLVLAQSKPTFQYVEQMPVFSGDMGKFISNNISYPDSARAQGIEGRVVVQFVVNEDGHISDVKVLRGIGGGCDEEAVRVVKAMPNWQPGKQNGEYVKVLFTLPIMFKLQDDIGVPSPDDKPKPELFAYVEQMPYFQGMHEYIAANIHYPSTARENNISGRVIVNFVVNEDGSISDVTLMRGIGGGCDEEAIRIVRSMPLWKPGKQNGRAVKVRYTLPIMFKLDNNPNTKTSSNK